MLADQEMSIALARLAALDASSAMRDLAASLGQLDLLLKRHTPGQAIAAGRHGPSGRRPT